MDLTMCGKWIFVSLTAALLCAGCGERERQNQTVLAIGMENPYLSLDPQIRNDSVTWSVLGNIYDPLVRFDSNMTIIPGLAERWENPNDVTWRFYLRKNIRFHSGKPLNADDVVYTIQRGRERAGTRSYLISVKDVRAVDSHTVDIITLRPNPVLLNRLPFIYILPAAGNQEAEIQKPVGTGPYVFGEAPAEGKMNVTANEQYWDGSPPIQQVRFMSFKTQEEQVEALVKGEVHLIRSFGEELTARLQSCRDCRILSYDSLGVAMLGFNLTDKNAGSPFLKKEVREAVAIGIDREKLVREGLSGKAIPVTQMVLPIVFGFDPAYQPQTQDPVRAKDLLVSAGYPEGFHSEFYGTKELRLANLESQLRELGIELHPKALSWPELNDKLMKHELPAFIVAWSCSTGDASDFLDNLVHSAQPEGGYGQFNIAGYSNQEVDRLIELSSQTLRPKERREYLQKALAMAASDYPYIPLYSRYRQYALRQDLVWQPRRDGRLFAVEMRWK